MKKTFVILMILILILTGCAKASVQPVEQKGDSVTTSGEESFKELDLQLNNTLADPFSVVEPSSQADDSVSVVEDDLSGFPLVELDMTDPFAF